jgi:HD-GYP domain-containing protein (c-di-GMP phosphodiesterase class II)
MANPKIKRSSKRSSKQNANRKPIKIFVEFKDWVHLPVTIKGKKIQAQLEFQSVQHALILYRAYVITCNYIATNINRGILNSYKWLQHEMKELVAFKEDNYLRFSSLKSLRSINERWDIFSTRQKELQHSIEQAPSAFSFYNKMASFKEIHQRENKEGLEISQKLSRAYQALDNAMNYIEKYDQEHSISAFGASVLSIEKAREYWGQKLEEIRNLENKNADLNLVIKEIENLARIIYDAPALAKWVNDIEKRFNHLAYDHDLLVDSYGKVIIQKEILEEINTIITSIVPKLWIQGQKDQIEQYLEEVDKFLGIYEPEVQTEITFAERHNLRKQARSSEQEQSLSHLLEVTKIFMAAIDVRDPLMSTHSLTVTRLAVATGNVMNWNQEEIQYLEIAALLHDVGKLWVPESILTKKEKLNSQDIRMLRMHPIYGAQILQSSGLFEKITPWIYHHQELWNGTGYPDGLKEDAIPIQSRIISVCEAFAAMLTGSPNRSPLTINEALERIKYEAGTFFDPVIVQSFVIAVESQEMDYLKKFVEK